MKVNTYKVCQTLSQGRHIGGESWDNSKGP